MSKCYKHGWDVCGVSWEEAMRAATHRRFTRSQEPQAGSVGWCASKGIHPEKRGQPEVASSSQLGGEKYGADHKSMRRWRSLQQGITRNEVASTGGMALVESPSATGVELVGLGERWKGVGNACDPR